MNRPAWVRLTVGVLLGAAVGALLVLVWLATDHDGRIARHVAALSVLPGPLTPIRDRSCDYCGRVAVYRCKMWKPTPWLLTGWLRQLVAVTHYACSNADHIAEAAAAAMREARR